MTACLISFRLVVAVIGLGWGSGVSMAQPDEQPLVANSNQAPAGQWADGRLIVRLEAAMGEWSPEEHDGPSLKVAAFREEGWSLSTPGPLLRVPEGTEIDGLAIGREAAARAVASYMDPGEPQAALDATADELPEAT